MRKQSTGLTHVEVVVVLQWMKDQQKPDERTIYEAEENIRGSSCAAIHDRTSACIRIIDNISMTHVRVVEVVDVVVLRVGQYIYGSDTRCKPLRGSRCPDMRPDVSIQSMNKVLHC